MTEYSVVANYWVNGSGWSHEEDVDRIHVRMTAEMYVNSLDDEDLAAYFITTGADAVQFDICDEDGNKISDYWVDREDVIEN